MHRQPSTSRRLFAPALVAWCVVAFGARAEGPDGAYGPPSAPTFASPTPDQPAPSLVRPSAAVESRPLGAPPPERPAGSTEVAPSTGLDAGTTIGALVLVAGLIIGASWILRAAARRGGSLAGMIGAGGRAPSGIVEVLGRYPLGRGCAIVLLRVERRVLVVSQTAARGLGGVSLSTLSEITDPEDVASMIQKSRDEEGETMASRFSAMLSSFEQEHQSPPADAGRLSRLRALALGGGPA